MQKKKKKKQKRKKEKIKTKNLTHSQEGPSTMTKLSSRLIIMDFVYNQLMDNISSWTEYQPRSNK